MPKSKDVDAFIGQMEHPLKAQIEKVRRVILRANPEITEQIKWNAPSFGVGGDDRITFNLRSIDKIQLIFHRGAKVKSDGDFQFQDDVGLLQWLARDRAIVKLDKEEIDDKLADLEILVDRWIRSTR